MIEPTFRVKCDHQGCTNSVTVYKRAEAENVALTRMDLSNGGWKTVRQQPDRTGHSSVRDFCPMHAGNGRTDLMDSIRALAEWIKKNGPDLSMNYVAQKLLDMIEDDD